MADQPAVELVTDFSQPDAQATPWAEVVEHLSDAGIFWVSTVRPGGRPHVTPLIAVWDEQSLHFCTGPDERKARNLAQNPRVTLTTGCNAYGEGLDVVVEGTAVRIDDDRRLERLAAAWEAKYGTDWHFDVRGGFFVSEGREALVFGVAPVTAFAFRKGEFSQTRYLFTR